MDPIGRGYGGGLLADLGTGLRGLRVHLVGAVRGVAEDVPLAGPAGKVPVR